MTGRPSLALMSFLALLAVAVFGTYLFLVLALRNRRAWLPVGIAFNLALLAFARMWADGDGQIFAIVVMVVAACEVAIGLGIIVALYRRRLPIDVDELRELHG